MRPLAMLVALLLALAGCTGDPAPTPSREPTPSPEPVATPTEPGSDEPFRCDLPFASPGDAGPNHVTGLRVAQFDEHDRIVFTFDHGRPTIELRQGRPPFTTDPAGEPLPVEGGAFLELAMHGTSRGGMDGPITYSGPTDFTPRGAVLTQLRMAGDFEATMGFVLGLTGPPCYRVFELAGPRRLVVDVRLR